MIIFTIKNKINDQYIDSIIFLTFVTTLGYCLFVFYNNLEINYFWTNGDDWTVFQRFSRLIVLDGQWFRGGEEVIYFRPGIRYVFALLHLIFGNSSFTIQMIDIWSIIFMFLLIFKILKKLNFDSSVSLFFSFIFLILIFGESFRWLIGKGLTEFFGAFIFLLTSYLALNYNFRISITSFVICFLIIITGWLREEKFISILSVIFLTKLYSIRKNYFIDFLYLLKNFKLILFYFSIIILFFPILLIIRNYYYSGSITVANNPVFLVVDYKSLYTIVTGVYHHQLQDL